MVVEVVGRSSEKLVVVKQGYYHRLGYRHRQRHRRHVREDRQKRNKHIQAQTERFRVARPPKCDARGEEDNISVIHRDRDVKGKKDFTHWVQGEELNQSGARSSQLI